MREKIEKRMREFIEPMTFLEATKKKKKKMLVFVS